MSLKEKIVVVMPAYNCARTLENVYKRIPKGLADIVLLIDDFSKDETVKVAKDLGIETIVHLKNLGYGGNQKTCYDKALKKGAKYVIMLHPDGQYDAKDLPLFTDALTKENSDIVLGSRFLGKNHKTPLYKAFSIKFITFLFNLILREKLTEVNTGYRGFSRKFLETIPLNVNGNGYIFDPQIIIQAAYFGFKVSEVPVSKDYIKEASSPNFEQSVKHGLENLQLLLEYILHVANIRKTKFLISKKGLS